MKLVKLAVVLVLAATLSGCGAALFLEAYHRENRTGDYKPR